MVFYVIIIGTSTGLTDLSSKICKIRVVGLKRICIPKGYIQNTFVRYLIIVIYFASSLLVFTNLDCSIFKVFSFTKTALGSSEFCESILIGIYRELRVVNGSSSSYKCCISSTQVVLDFE
jgi:hypothetical protein